MVKRPVFNQNTSLTSKDAALKEVSDCVQRNDEARQNQLNTHLHLYWQDLHDMRVCVCRDEKTAVPRAFNDDLEEDFHASHPARMVCMAQRCWWPYLNRKFFRAVSYSIGCKVYEKRSSC